MAKISLLGMNNYNNKLFELFTVPEELDRDVLINNILIKSADYEVVYPDFDMCRLAIGNWCAIWERTMEKWVSSISVDWNPIENYDRYEDYTDTNIGSASKNNTKSETKTANNESIENRSDGVVTSGSDTNTSSGSGSNTSTRAASDSASWENDSKTDTSSSGNSSTDTESSSNATGQTETHDSIAETTGGSEKETSSNNETMTHTAHIHGNIGVTTSSSMYLEYNDAAVWNIYENITNLFLKDFVIPVF